MQMRRADVKRTVRRTINASSAAEAVGPITHGCEIYGLSKGQFSLIELVEHVLNSTGPADVVISTWTAAGADLAHTQTFLTDGRLRTCRWLVDYSFPSRQPAYCADLRARFGDDAIRATANHAKFVLATNDTWHITLRTSMNLNLNRRLESYEISDDADLAACLHELVAEAFNGGAAPISEAAAQPGRAKAAVNNLAGGVARRDPELSYRGGHGVSFD